MNAQPAQALNFLLNNSSSIIAALKNVIAFGVGLITCIFVTFFLSKTWMLDNVINVFVSLVVLNIGAQCIHKYEKSRSAVKMHRKNVETMVKDARRRNVVRNLD